MKLFDLCPLFPGVVTAAKNAEVLANVDPNFPESDELLNWLKKKSLKMPVLLFSTREKCFALAEELDPSQFIFLQRQNDPMHA